MKVIKESAVGTIFEVGLIPSGSDRYACLEEPLQNFESFEMAKDFVDGLNINEYEGYDIVVVTAKKDARSPDNAWQSEVYRREGTKLTEGPIKRFLKGIGKSDAEKAKMEREEKEGKAQNAAMKVLARDLSSKAKDWLYYVPDASGKYPSKPISNREFLSKFKVDDKDSDGFKFACNALVVDSEGMYVRRALEDLLGKKAKCNPNGAKIKPSFTWEEVFNVKSAASTESDSEDPIEDTPVEEAPVEERPPVEETPVEETPVEEAPVDSSSSEITEATFTKFALLAKATGIKVTGPRGGEITKLATLKKINAETASKMKVEVGGKTYILLDYIKMLKNNKLIENATLTEKVWKHKIDKDLAFRLRDALEADETDYEELREAMKAVYDNIHSLVPDMFDEYECEDVKEDLDMLDTESSDDDADYDDVDWMDEDDIESDWNYALENLYDLCDAFDIWIPIRGLDEGLTDANAYKIVYHKNTACRDRRPETADDVEDDWTEAPVRADSDLDALQRAIAIIHDCDVEDVIDDGFDSEESCISYLEEADWGDGSPIIIRVEGPDGNLFDTGYDKDSWIEEFCEAEDYDTYEESLKSRKKTLTEAPIIKLNDTDIMNPGKVDFKQKIADATAEEEAEKARQAEEARKEQFRVKYKDVPAKLEASLGKGADAEETLEVLFEDLVPRQGAADTVAGEMVRAMMRVLYRDSNDGDKFFMGYGLETCAGSVTYLAERIDTVANRVTKMLDEVFRYEDDDRYTEALKGMTEDVIDHIMNNQELIFTPNEEDSRDYNYDEIEEKQPRYEFECDGSDDVCTLVNEGILTGWDLYHYVEDQLQWDNAYEGAEVERPWGYDSTSITVSNLTIEGYEQLEDSFNRNRDGWWEDLVSEHQDELDRINNGDDDYEEDDDIDEGLINARPELRHIAEKLQAKSEDLTFLANEFDKALTNEGFNYDIDIVEGFKINVKSDDIKAIDDFASEFFKKYNLAVDIEDKGDSHNYMLRKASTKTAKQEGFLDIFKKKQKEEPSQWEIYNRDYDRRVYGPYATKEEARAYWDMINLRSSNHAAELGIREVTESLKEEFLSYEDVMQGMMDNSSNETIDADIRLFNKVASTLGLRRPEDIVIYVDGEGMYDPVYYADSSTKINKIVSQFTCGPITCLSERRNGNTWIYFNNKEDADQYIRFVNAENGLE